MAVDIGSPPPEPADYESALGVATQVSDLLIRRRYVDFSATADVLVRPDLGQHSASDYSGFDELIAKGYEATKASLPQIRAKLAEAGSRTWHRAERSGGARPGGTRIAAVRVEGNERVNEGLARRTFNIPVGRGYVMARGVRAFDKIDASELFDRTWLEFAPAREGVDVVLRVKEAPPIGPRWGSGTRSGRRRGALSACATRTPWASASRWSCSSRGATRRRSRRPRCGESGCSWPGFGYRVTAYANDDKPRFFDEAGDEINRARFDRNGVDVALRTSLERWGLVEGGARFGRVKTRSRGRAGAAPRPMTRWERSSAAW